MQGIRTTLLCGYYSRVISEVLSEARVIRTSSNEFTTSFIPSIIRFICAATAFMIANAFYPSADEQISKCHQRCRERTCIGVRLVAEDADVLDTRVRIGFAGVEFPAGGVSTIDRAYDGGLTSECILDSA